jgi:phosphatidylserine/phosphatidylglycerophosphate/cardiolipin synthase-like enzyme
MAVVHFGWGRSSDEYWNDRWSFPISMISHAKAIIIDDDKVFIGSANLDPRSLRVNGVAGSSSRL